jgi:ubiquinol oxidase
MIAVSSSKVQRVVVMMLVPHFACASVLHFLETFGQWRKVEYLKLHFAEDWNELHHLLIMEELGGNESWFDRFIAQHIALAHHFMVFAACLHNPTLAHDINEAVEEHAFITHATFLTDDKAKLMELPAPKIAQECHRDGDLHLFDEFQTGICEPRRPKMDTLHDCFCAIRDDEEQHMQTMRVLQTSVQLRTPHSFQNLQECLIEHDEISGVPNIVSSPPSAS